MTKVEEIVAAAQNLSGTDFVRLRKRLDRVEKSRWEAELRATTDELHRAGIGDRQIDQMILRRRRESRS
jgi:hypothetical protein